MQSGGERRDVAYRRRRDPIAKLDHHDHDALAGDESTPRAVAPVRARERRHRPAVDVINARAYLVIVGSDHVQRDDVIVRRRRHINSGEAQTDRRRDVLAVATVHERRLGDERDATFGRGDLREQLVSIPHVRERDGRLAVQKCPHSRVQSRVDLLGRSHWSADPVGE